MFLLKTDGSANIEVTNYREWKKLNIKERARREKITNEYIKTNLQEITIKL